VIARTSRRRVLQAGAGAVLTMPFVRSARAQEKSIQVGIYNGPQGEFVRKEMIPKFEADYRCKVFADGALTLGQIARLRATKDNPKYSVMLMDDIGVEVAKREDLIIPLDSAKVPNLETVIPRFLMFDRYGAGFAISTGGLCYNTQATKPVETYAQLWDPRFRKRFSIVSPESTQSVFMVIAAAAVVTGKPYRDAQYLSDQAWPLLEKLKPNVVSVYGSSQSVQFLIQGDADIAGIEYSKLIYPYKLKKAPVDMNIPREGAFAAVNCVTMVKNGPHPELAAAFVNRLLDASVQKPLAEFTVAAPSVVGLTLSSSLREAMAYPESRMDELGLFSGDWVYLNTQRAAWLEKMNRIFVNA
jgi:putative spermidine/putrescine transport system substrate-binding protein